MFQNVEKNINNRQDFNEAFYDKKDKMKIAIKSLLSINNIIIYIIAFMVSMVGFSSHNIMLGLSPFAIAFMAAMLSNGNPVGIVYILTLIGTFIKFGPNVLLTYVLTSLVFFASSLFVRHNIIEDTNEEKRLGVHLFASVLIVQIVPMFFRSFLLYDLLLAIMVAVITFIFYKIFANSIIMLKEFRNKKAFTIEEVIGTSLLLAIAVCAVGDLSIFGFSIKNILSILIVLILGWKNGMLVGATGGITIGVVLGIISGTEPMMIAAYAISGLIAGILNKFGRIGVVVGFILGNVILTYVANGNTVPIITIQEILIACLGLLAIPKKLKINIEDLYGKTKLLPETTGRSIGEAQDNTILKLNSMSETIADLAKGYKTIEKEDKKLKKQKLSNENIFIEELKNNLINLEENILFDDIYNNNNNILHEIFEELLKNDVIYEKNLVSIFEAHNNYIVGFHEKNKAVEADISKMINAINSSYRLSRVNFVWKKKIEQNKENISNQLEGVSQAIADLADEIKKDNEDEFADKREELMRAFQEKKFDIRNLNIKRLKNGRYIIDIYHNLCDDLEGKKCNIKRIKTILERILKDKFIIQHQECGLRESKEQCKFTYMSQDKFSVQIGISKTTKAGSPVSGDTNLETKLEDGKYLLAISDGMGSGPEAMKSSKVAIKTLERLLTAGFDKTMSLKLINSILEITQKDDMYATLDVEILDLYSGIMEFVKNGACPTYLKRNKEVQLLKANTLPAGAIEKMDLEVYDCDLQDGDIIVMCSDGVIESNDEYINKEVWVKYLLEDMQTDDAQKIADILLKESIDNDYGTQKDDMTVIVAKISKKLG